ncbi:hypothetical protein VCV18_011488 [Metarhizium anisopliae]
MDGPGDFQGTTEALHDKFISYIEPTSMVAREELPTHFLGMSQPLMPDTPPPVTIYITVNSASTTCDTAIGRA